MMSLIGFVLSFLLMMTVLDAHAVGPVVGRNCVATWSAVTTRIDGSATTGTISYRLYLSAGTPTAPPATPALTTTSLTAQPCLTIAPGQYTAWISSVETIGTAITESSKSAAFPFVFGAPAVPGSFIIK